jgi:hypothetical protein
MLRDFTTFQVLPNALGELCRGKERASFFAFHGTHFELSQPPNVCIRCPDGLTHPLFPPLCDERCR